MRRDPRISRYTSVITAVEQKEELSRDNGPLAFSAVEKRQILEMLSGDVYQQQTSRFTRPLLLRLDSLIAGQGADYYHKIITVEHVLPQNPDSESTWVQVFPCADVRDEWTHKLANLVLLSRRKNAQARNYDFQYKKKEYFQKKDVPPFAITTQVINHEEWTPAVLECRQSELINAFKEEWHLS